MAEFYLKNSDNNEIIRVGKVFSKWTILANKDVNIKHIEEIPEKILTEDYTKISREKFEDIMLVVGLNMNS